MYPVDDTNHTIQPRAVRSNLLYPLISLLKTLTYLYYRPSQSLSLQSPVPNSPFTLLIDPTIFLLIHRFIPFTFWTLIALSLHPLAPGSPFSCDRPRSLYHAISLYISYHIPSLLTLSLYQLVHAVFGFSISPSSYFICHHRPFDTSTFHKLLSAIMNHLYVLMKKVELTFFFSHLLWVNIIQKNVIYQPKRPTQLKLLPQ